MLSCAVREIPKIRKLMHSVNAAHAARCPVVLRNGCLQVNFVTGCVCSWSRGHCYLLWLHCKCSHQLLKTLEHSISVAQNNTSNAEYRDYEIHCVEGGFTVTFGDGLRFSHHKRIVRSPVFVSGTKNAYVLFWDHYKALRMFLDLLRGVRKKGRPQWSF